MNTWNRWQDWVNVALGVWLIVAPFILATGFNPTSMWNAIVVGAVVALVALAMPYVTLAEYANMLLGGWLIVSPFVLRFTDLSTAAWNAFIVGILVLGAALWALPSASRAQAEHPRTQAAATR
jgi:hypothetical protein